MQVGDLVNLGLAAVAVLTVVGRDARSEDCNQNGIEDAVDVAPGALAFTGSWPVSIQGSPRLAIDFNNDRRADLVSIRSVKRNRFEPSCSILSINYNNGFGGVVDGPDLATSCSGDISLTAADLNGDAWTDLASASDPGTSRCS
jgi:FG-GAP-like repeat